MVRTGNSYAKHTRDFGSARRNFLANVSSREIEESQMIDFYDIGDFSMIGPGNLRYDVEMAHFERDIELARKMEIMLADKSSQEDMMWDQYESGYLADECFRFPTLKDRGFKSCEIEGFEDYENSKAVGVILDTLKFYGEDADLADALPSETQLNEWARNKLEYKILQENSKIRMPTSKIIGYMDLSKLEQYSKGATICPFDVSGAIVSYDDFLREEDAVACGGAINYN